MAATEGKTDFATEAVRARTAWIELLAAQVSLIGTAAAVLKVAAVEAGLFALAGVIIGGVLNGLVSWVLARNTSRSNARVAALLVNEELMQSIPALLGLREHKNWGWLSAAHEFGRRDVWDENRTILGHALDPDAYMSIAAGYSGLGSARDTAAREEFSAPISDAQGKSLATTYLTINQGFSYLGLLLHRPSRWHPRARRAFDRETKEHIDGLLKKDRKYQDFMAKHGRDS